MLYRWCQAGGEGLFTCSLNELNRNLNFVKEEFGNPQRLGYVLVVCIRFSELILVSAYLQVLARGGGRVTYHEQYLIQRFLKDYSNWLWFPYKSSLIVSFE